MNNSDENQEKRENHAEKIVKKKKQFGHVIIESVHETLETSTLHGVIQGYHSEKFTVQIFWTLLLLSSAGYCIFSNYIF